LFASAAAACSAWQYPVTKHVRTAAGKFLFGQSIKSNQQKFISIIQYNIRSLVNKQYDARGPVDRRETNSLLMSTCPIWRFLILTRSGKCTDLFTYLIDWWLIVDLARFWVYRYTEAIRPFRFDQQNEKRSYHTMNMSATTSTDTKNAYTTQYIIHFTYKTSHSPEPWLHFFLCYMERRHKKRDVEYCFYR